MAACFDLLPSKKYKLNIYRNNKFARGTMVKAMTASEYITIAIVYFLKAFIQIVISSI